MTARTTAGDPVSCSSSIRGTNVLYRSFFDPEKPLRQLIMHLKMSAKGNENIPKRGVGDANGESINSRISVERHNASTRLSTSVWCTVWTSTVFANLAVYRIWITASESAGYDTCVYPHALLTVSRTKRPDGMPKCRVQLQSLCHDRDNWRVTAAPKS